MPLIGRFECANEVLDHRPAGIGGPSDGDDVKPVAMFQQIVPFEITQRQPRQALLLLLIDGFERVAGDVAFASFHLDENNDSIAIDGHDGPRRPGQGVMEEDKETGANQTLHEDLPLMRGRIVPSLSADVKQGSGA